MSTSVRRRVVAWAGGGVLLAGGAAAATRWRARAQRRAELDRSYAQLTAQLCALHEDKLRRTHELQERQAAARRLRETVDTLWRDRLARYARVTDDLRAYVRALPEALGVLHGVTQHYAYMASEARRFVGFDVACAKLHSLALLLHAARRTSSGSDVVRSPRAAVSAATMAEATTRTAHARSDNNNNNNDKRSDKGNSDDGNDTAAAATTATTATTVQDAHMCSFPQVLSTLRDFFASEPLVCAVCTALQPTASMTCATSVADSSATFAYCMQQLHDRVDAVVARCASSSSNGNNSNDTTQKDGSDTGLLYELAGRLVAALSFDLRPRVARRVQAQQSALQQQLLRERYALHTPADVYAAVVYAHVLLRQLHDSNNNDDNTATAAAAAATAMTAAAASCSSSEAATTTASDTSVQHVSAVDALLTPHATHTSDATSAATMLHAVRSDAAVQVALRDLAAWSRAAAVMLARAQALDALDCYHTLLSTTVMHE